MTASKVILVIGSGGREHALAWKLSQSKNVGKIYVAPGNGGTGSGSDVKISNIDLNVSDFEAVIAFCRHTNVSLAVVGPEQPLVDGIESAFKQSGIPCFGPSAAAAQLEASKSFAKKFMAENNIPTAEFKSFTDYNQAVSYVKQVNHDVVIKASGLAAGKGVVIPSNKDEAIKALEDMMVNKQFGSAGETVVIEEKMSGPEISVFALSDGYSTVLLPPCQDHKKIGEGETGLNTGGMGAYAPTPFATKDVMKFTEEKIVNPTISGMRKSGTPFVGVLFLGLMLTPNGPRLLEYNVRFGDPETEVLMPLFSDNVDLVQVFEACAGGYLDAIDITFKNAHAATVVAVSGGYPGSYEKSKSISLPSSSSPMTSTGIIFHAGTKLDKDQQLVTNGGRVLAVTHVNETELRGAVNDAYVTLSQIEFQGMYFRKDIAFQALAMEGEGGGNSKDQEEKMSYADAGVDIAEGNRFVDLIKPLTKATKRSGCDAAIGGFGGLFDLNSSGYDSNDTILVGATDGVGTKLKVAQLAEKHDTIGQDLVAMCVNDLIVQGAEPLFFLDYYACGHLDTKTAVDVVKGIADGCKLSNCALMGGETAEMPGMYGAGDYDLAGFSVGATRPSSLLPKTLMTGQVLLGLTSSGVHSNGYSLVRRIVEKSGLSYNDPVPFHEQDKNIKTLGEALLKPTRIYVKSLMPLIKEGNKIQALCHITGGGFWENVPRILTDNLKAHFDMGTMMKDRPAVFNWLKTTGNVDVVEMLRTFNCGFGMVVVVNSEDVHYVTNELQKAGETVCKIGALEARTDGGEPVVIDNLEMWV